MNLKIKKPTLFCYFTFIVFIELNFTVAFLLVRKTWDDQFADKVGGMGDFKKCGGYPSNGGIILEWGVDTPLQTMNEHYTQAGSAKYCAPNRVTIFSESL